MNEPPRWLRRDFADGTLIYDTRSGDTHLVLPDARTTLDDFAPLPTCSNAPPPPPR